MPRAWIRTFSRDVSWALLCQMAIYNVDYDRPASLCPRCLQKPEVAAWTTWSQHLKRHIRTWTGISHFNGQLETMFQMTSPSDDRVFPASTL